jgi:hypothetical protein
MQALPRLSGGWIPTAVPGDRNLRVSAADRGDAIGYFSPQR